LKENAMNTKGLVLPLLLVVAGCGNHPNSDLAGTDAMLSREQILRIAEDWVRKTDHVKEGDRLVVIYDNGNEKWLSFLKESEQDEPEAARFFRKMLDGRDYQAVFTGYESLTLGGTYCVLIDRKTGEVITSAAGV